MLVSLQSRKDESFTGPGVNTEDQNIEDQKILDHISGPYEECLIEELGIFINMPKRSLRPAIQRSTALLTSGET